MVYHLWINGDVWILLQLVGFPNRIFPFLGKMAHKSSAKWLDVEWSGALKKQSAGRHSMGKSITKKNSRCTEGMLLLSANLELQAQAFANAFTNAPHIIYVLRTQICLYMCMHFSIVSIYKLSGPWGTCLKSDCCMFHICSHHKQSNLTFVHPAIKRNRISSIYGGLKKLGKSMN